MGNPTRCPSCNKYGNSDLDGYCKRCDTEIFMSKAFKEASGSKRVIDSVLLEFGVSAVNDVRREKRKEFINMIKRRRPSERDGHIARGASKLEKYGYRFATDPEKASIIKGVPDIEQME